MHRLLRPLSLCAALLAAPAAQAQLLGLDWDAAGQFHLDQPVGPGHFIELCGPMTKDQQIEWQFESAMSLDFNVHVHQGRRVVFPVRQDEVKRSAGILTARAEQEYCWMWTNTTGLSVRLNLTLKRR